VEADAQALARGKEGREVQKNPELGTSTLSNKTWVLHRGGIAGEIRNQKGIEGYRVSEKLVNKRRAKQKGRYHDSLPSATLSEWRKSTTRLSNRFRRGTRLGEEVVRRREGLWYQGGETSRAQLKFSTRNNNRPYGKFGEGSPYRRTVPPRVREGEQYRVGEKKNVVALSILACDNSKNLGKDCG